jgi:hypothetical protein
MQDQSVDRHFSDIQDLADQILQCLREEVAKLGFSASEAPLKEPKDAVYRLERDASNGKYSLMGDWRDDHGIKIGSLVFHSDGSFFVEQDVIKAHPRDAKWFVEAVNAWGRYSEIKAEARLLPSLAD